MNHLLEISLLEKTNVEYLFRRALSFKNHTAYPNYQDYILANLFYENSTRTRVSFELAARNLSMTVVNLDLASSSERKGECIEDTVKTLAAMGVSLFVIRHASDGIPKSIAACCPESVHVVNAGDGQHAHPSQALLDFMTIVERKPHLERLKIAIVGDLRHSRVANSLQCLSALCGVGELALVSPDFWCPRVAHYGRVTSSLQEGLDGADVVICLRVQHERLQVGEQLDLASYRSQFTVTEQALRWAKPDAIVMHPGPMNRGIEIDSEVADGAQSLVLEQVKNGVFMRTAILEALIQ